MLYCFWMNGWCFSSNAFLSQLILLFLFTVILLLTWDLVKIRSRYYIYLVFGQPHKVSIVCILREKLKQRLNIYRLQKICSSAQIFFLLLYFFCKFEYNPFMGLWYVMFSVPFEIKQKLTYGNDLNILFLRKAICPFFGFDHIIIYE